MKKKYKVQYYFFLIIYGIILNVTMLGNDNLYGSITDWLGQHTVFPEVFRQAFYESGQLVPNFLFQIGGGQNAFHFTYYGFLSPVILLSYLLPFVEMTNYIMVASFLLYIATGILVFIFLRYHFGERKALASAIIFLTLSPIHYHFHHHIMFVWYLPFLMLAFIALDCNFANQYSNRKKLIQKARILFLVSVFCMILTNYYFSVGSLVCLLVYALYCILNAKKSTLKDFGKQTLQTIYLFLIPVLLSAFVLLPTAYGLFGNSRSYAESGSVVVEQTAMGDVTMDSVTDAERMEVVWQNAQELLLPNLPEAFLGSFSMGLTGLMLVAVIGSLTCKGRKKSDLFLNAILLLVAACPLMSYMLNGMLYARGKVLIPFAILFVFVLNQFVQRVERKEIQWNYCIGFTVIFVVFCSFLRADNQEIGAYILLGLGAAVLCKRKPEMLYLGTIAILLVTSIRENTEETYVSVDAYEKLYSDEIEELLEYTKEDWFRTNIAYKENLTGNRVYGNKFYGTSIYSSTFNRLYQDFYKTYMGNNERYRNAFLTSGARNELFYTFMGTRYIIGESDPGIGYEKIAESEHLNLYENPQAYPMIYKSADTMVEMQFDTLQFPYSTEALMTHTILGNGKEAEYVSQIEEIPVSRNYQFVQEEKEIYEIVLDESFCDKLLYLTFNIVNEGEFRNKKDVSIRINGVKNTLTKDTWLYYNGNTTFDYVISLEDTNTLTIEITKGLFDIQNLHMYCSPMIAELYEAVNDVKLNTFKSQIACKVEANRGEYLVTSIPYDKGFSARVNGKEAEVEVVNKGFVGLALEEGENGIIIRYTAPLFRIGCLVSLLGMLCFLVEVFLYWKEKGQLGGDCI